MDDKKITNRRLTSDILHYKNFDHIPAVRMGYWRELVEEWVAQGKLGQEYMTMNNAEKEEALDKVFDWDYGWAMKNGVYMKKSLNPYFERKVLETYPEWADLFLVPTITYCRGRNSNSYSIT